jgi:nitrite reductase/ring-hydroxylating ferredoxin subunit
MSGGVGGGVRAAREPVELTELDGGRRVRVRIADQEFVIDAACPHRKGRLVHGHVNPRTLRITCPLHRSVFDLVTGEPLAGPATECLTVSEPVPQPVRRCVADPRPDGAAS